MRLRQSAIVLTANILFRLGCAEALITGISPARPRTGREVIRRRPSPVDCNLPRRGRSSVVNRFSLTRTCAAQLTEATTSRTATVRRKNSQRGRNPTRKIHSSRSVSFDLFWGLHPPSAETVIREPSVTALEMAGLGDDAGGGKGAGEGEMKTPVIMKGAWISLAMLLLVYISNQWTRSLVYYVQNFDAASTAENAQEFMNVGLGFDETQYGLLASFSFTLLFSTFSLVAGRAVDVVSRKTATIVSCLVWSVMAAGTAIASGFPAVFVLRVLQGSAQAFTTPAAYTLISDLFPPSSRGTANAIYSSGVYLGGALASLSLLLNGAVGWRQSHEVVAAAGFTVALLSFFLLQDPGKGYGGGVGEIAAVSQSNDAGQQRSAVSLPDAKNSVAAVKAMVGEIAAGAAAAGAGETEEEERGEGVAAEAARLLIGGGDGKGGKEDRESFREALGIVFESDTVKLLFAATAFRFCAGFGIGVWCAPFFRGRFPSFSSEYSVLNAFVVAGGGVLSSFLGGVISDKYSVQDVRVRAWVPMAGSLLAIPCWIGVVSGTDFYTSLAFLLAEYVVAECWFGPTVTILQEDLPQSVRGVGQGVFSTLSAFGTLAPPLMGALMSRGGLQIQDVLTLTVPTFYFVSAAFFYFVGESLLKDNKEKLKEA